MLLGLAVTELAVNRVAVPMLRPVGSPPLWHTALDYLGLFSFYFVGTLSALLVLARAWAGVRAPEDRRSRVAAIALAVAGALASIPLVVDAPAELSVPLEAAFAGAVIALVVASGGRQRDLGLQLATPVFVAPLLLHSVGVIGGRFLWPDNTFDGAGYVIAQAALMALCLAALITPYGFSPRPFARAIVRPAPVLAAIATSIAGAYLARASYPFVLRATQLAIGIELTPGQPDPRLSMYLLALATLVWTLVACARASTPARRSIGQGLALIALAGFAFKWPHHYLLSLLGLARIADAARTVRDEERAASPLASATPPIADAAWSAFIAQLTSGLGRVLTDVHSLTARGEGGLASSVIVGAAAGLAVRARIDRIDGCVLGLDVVLGRERDEATPATLTLWSVAPRALGTNPASPPATPAFRCGDDPFDRYALSFKVDEPTRAACCRCRARIKGNRRLLVCQPSEDRVCPWQDARRLALMITDAARTERPL